MDALEELSKCVPEIEDTNTELKKLVEILNQVTKEKLYKSELNHQANVVSEMLRRPIPQEFRKCKRSDC